VYRKFMQEKEAREAEALKASFVDEQQDVVVEAMDGFSQTRPILTVTPGKPRVKLSESRKAMQDIPCSPPADVCLETELEWAMSRVSLN
jgi:hypothetical protein